MLFLGNKLSDFMGFNPDKAKTAPLGTVLTNGAASKNGYSRS